MGWQSLLPPGVSAEGWNVTQMDNGSFILEDLTGTRDSIVLGGAWGYIPGMTSDPNRAGFGDPNYGMPRGTAAAGAGAGAPMAGAPLQGNTFQGQNTGTFGVTGGQDDTEENLRWNLMGNPQGVYRAGLERIGMNPNDLDTGSEFSRYVLQALNPMASQSLVSMAMGGQKVLGTEETKDAATEYLRNQYNRGGAAGYDVGSRLRWLAELGRKGVEQPGYGGGGEAEMNILKTLRGSDPEAIANLVGSQFATRGSAYATNQTAIPALLRSLQREQQSGRLGQANRNVMDVVREALGGF